MDDYERTDLDESDLHEILSTPVVTTDLLALLAWEEANDVLGLVTLSQENGPMSREADRLAKAIAVRIPSEN
ncbi:DUF6417 family protein [Streptomyces sp. E2N166]|uniref:DUF6417 family protein n=1 Tax=Streptomyces sp. E2N166 TaxID=1851909 RepID=UPI000EF70793|nr:DUF6417 family protein [Streptomyces sp. E2N166]